MNALENTKWPFQFHGYFYRLCTNGKFIEEVVPATEYYKICYRAMSQKCHGVLLALQYVEETTGNLSRSYLARRTTTGAQSQPKLIFTTELYKVRTDFSTLLFLIRSTLDQFASLIQFLSGPKSKPFSSFADVMKECRKCSTANPPPEFPVELFNYLKSCCDWFWRMRDIRDYIAHHGFVSLHLVQSPSNELKFYVHERYDILELAREYTREFQLLLEMIDVRYSKRIQEAS